MNVLRDRRIALAAATGAAGLWIWIFVSGGVVRHPPRKPDRAVHGAIAETQPQRVDAPVLTESTSAGDTADPRAQLAALEQRLDALARDDIANDGDTLERDLAAWQRARERARLEAVAVREFGATGDAPLDAWLLAHPLGGTRVRGTRRIASFGPHVVHEGDVVADGAARIARIEPAGVVVACRGRELLVPVRAAPVEAEDVR